MTIPANIKNLKINCIKADIIMSVLFSFQSRNFIKLNKSKHKLAKFRHICRLLFFFFFFFNKLSLEKNFKREVERLNVKSVDHYDTGHMSRLIWIYAVCKSIL